MEVRLGEFFELEHPVSRFIEMWEVVNVSGTRVELRAITGGDANDLDRTLSASIAQIAKYRSEISGSTV